MIFWLLIVSLVMRMLALGMVLCGWRRLSLTQFALITLVLVAMTTQTLVATLQYFAESAIRLDSSLRFPERILDVWVSLLALGLVGLFLRKRGLRIKRQLLLDRPGNRRLTYAAISIAAMAVIASVGAAWLAFQNSRNTLKENVAKRNLVQSQLLVQQLENRIADEVIERESFEFDIDEAWAVEHANVYWRNSIQRGPDAILIMIDKHGKLIFHSTNQGMIGNQVADVDLGVGHGNIRAVLEKQDSIATEHVDDQGVKQLAGYAPMKSLNVLVGVMVPSRKMEGDIQKASMPWFVAFIVISVILIPFAIGLIHRGFVTAQKDAILASNALLRNEQKIQKQFAELELLYLTAPVGLCLMDRELKFVRINEQLAEINGHPPEDHIGKSIHDILPDIAEVIEPFYQQVIETGEAKLRFDIERPSLESPGESSHFVASYFPLKDEKQNVIGVSTVVQEITKRKRFESKLRESEGKYRALVENAPVCIHEVDLTGNLQSMNAAGLQMMGVSDENEIRGICYFSAVCIEDRKSIVDHFMNAIRGVAGQFAFRTPEGREFESSFVPMYDMTGKIERVMGITQDVTDRKQAQFDLEASERRFRALVENSYDVINMFSATGDLIYTSPSVTRVLGYEPEEIKAIPAAELIHPDDLVQAFQTFEQASQEPRSVNHFTHRLLHKNGTYRTVEITGTNLLDLPGVNAMVSNFRDITEQTETEARLLSQQTELAHVSRLSTLGELVAGIAHEVRQPLHAISNFSTAATVMLKNEEKLNSVAPELLAELKECNEGIRSASNRANDIIQRLQSYARKGQGTIEPVSLNQIILDSVDLLGFQVRQFNIDLKLNLYETEDLAVVDKIQIEQVVINLLKNAFEALKQNETTKRLVEIETLVVDDQWMVTITDNGPGIPKGKDGKLYEAFFTTKSDGMGMGLAISRTIVESHRGRLWHTRNDLDGCSFHFALPLVHSDSTRDRQSSSLIESEDPRSVDSS